MLTKPCSSKLCITSTLESILGKHLSVDHSALLITSDCEHGYQAPQSPRTQLGLMDAGAAKR